MTDRPILFNAPMVRAILEGRKTQTRRIVKPPRGYQSPEDFHEYAKIAHTTGGVVVEQGGNDLPLPCPFGQPGDRLWVRETFAIEDPREYWYEDPRKGITPDRPWQWRDDEWGNRPLIPHYRADGIDPHIVDDDQMDMGDDCTRWRPSIHMPRWASRITLAITGVRVERLNDISEDDAKAEGIKSVTKDGSLVKYGIPDRDGLPGDDDDGWPWQRWDKDPRVAFLRLWEAVYGQESVVANPWVWVVEFKKAES